MVPDNGITNAIITSATLGFGDRGFLDCWLSLDYGGSSQGFGGFTLYLPPSFANSRLLSPAGHYLYRVMEVAGVENWASVPGRCIRARLQGGVVRAIGHIVRDDWFCPADDYRNIN